MSDFRKLLLAFAAVTLLAGIASAGIQPVLTTSAQPLSVRMEVSAPENTVLNLFPAESVPCGAGFQTAPAWLNQSGMFTTNNAPNNFGDPAAMPAPNIAALNTAQAADHLAGTPANLPNSENISARHSNWAQNSILNGSNTPAADSSALTVANTGHTFVNAGNNATNAPASSPAQVARTAPTHAGKAG